MTVIRHFNLNQLLVKMEYRPAMFDRGSLTEEHGLTINVTKVKTMFRV